MAHLIKGNKWSHSRMIYKYGTTVAGSSRLRKLIEDVMEEIHDLSAVSFRERTDESVYVVFRIGEAARGSADVGCQGTFVGIGGRQQINLPRDWSKKSDVSLKRTIRHEMLHALGFYHEHQRRDRDSHIDVLVENMSAAEYADNHTKKSSSQSKHDGKYDLDSVMHYGSAGSGDPHWIPAAWNRTAFLSTSAENLLIRYGILAGMVGISRIVDGSMANPLDIKPLVAPLTFDTMVPYSVTTAAAVHHFLFFLSSTTGRVEIHRLHADGTLGARTFHDQWTTGWTTADVVMTTGGTYMAMLKHDTGELAVHRMWHSGTISSRQDSKNWTDGYTHLVFARVENAGEERTYLLLHKSSNGHINIHRLDTDGTLSDRKHHYNWTSGWTTLKSWRGGGAAPWTFLLLLKRTTGHIVVHRVGWTGSLGSRLDHVNWTSGYTDACIYDHNDARVLLLHKATSGVVKTHQISNRGEMGDKVDPLWLVADNGTTFTSRTHFSRGDGDALRHRYGDP